MALLCSDPVGAGLSEPQVVLLPGLAVVYDEDLQAITDRYLRKSRRWRLGKAVRKSACPSLHATGCTLKG
jgi:hypothetical protein